MNILIAGGTGFIGGHVRQFLIEHQHDVIILSRNHEHASKHVPQHESIVSWDALMSNPNDTIEHVDAVINLAGAPIADARWTASRKQLLIDSRVESTRRLVEAIGQVNDKPRVLINASGIGFYGSDDTVTMTECSPQGSGFLADLCEKWENEANRATEFGLRVVCLRIGMVLGSDGGALKKMIPPFKVFAGGPISPGTQKVSWIHVHDLARIMKWLLANSTISGPVNAVAPQCVTMTEFCTHLGKSINRPSWLPVPAFTLKLLLGELSDMLTTGQHVEPRAIAQDGFTFQYPALNEALQSLFDPASA